MKRVSLKTKILTLIITLILFIIILITAVNAYFETQQTEENMGQRALQVAKTVSSMPTIKQAFEMKEPSKVIQPIARHICEMVGAEFVVVGNTQSVRYSHPQPYKIGEKMVGGDNDKALVHGEYYTSKAVGSLGPSLRGKAPIFNDKGEIIGIVSVGFMIEDIKIAIFNKLIKQGSVSLIVLLLGIIGGIHLTRSIRKDTFGLEPRQIASLFQERNAILQSIKEGIIAIDETGKITMMNESAQNMLGLTKVSMYKNVESILPNIKMYDVLHSGKSIQNDELFLRNRMVVVNHIPIVEKGEIIGVVSSFRDKTELQEMLNTLSEVKQYSQDLRAQTHEYTNKLYVLSGLLQLGHYNEAIKFIQLESKTHDHQTRGLVNHVKDRTVQAILLGKMGKASEKKVDLQIDSMTNLDKIPEHIHMASLIMILGNLIDNAIEAVENQKNGKVTFFATDEGNDIVLEVADSGEGINWNNLLNIFYRGFSTKNNQGRGFGLANVQEVVKELQGTIEVQNQKNSGAVFTVFLPGK
nr:sensor histidine kinase [Salinibacillus kushneri]